VVAHDAGIWTTTTLSCAFSGATWTAAAAPA